MKWIKTAARCALFLALLALVTVGVFNVLTWKNAEGIRGLYRLPSNRTDVLFVGSSHSYCTVNTAMLWEDYGIAAVDISEAGQVFPIGYHYLREALKTQRPKIVFLELFGIDRGVHIESGTHYRNSLNMKWSKNYAENADYIIGDIRRKIVDENELSAIRKGIYLKFPVVHSRYSELTEDDFARDEGWLRFSSNWSSRAFDPPEALNEKGADALTDVQRRYLDGVVELSKQHGFRLVFWVAPYCLNAEHARQYNAVKAYAGENGVDFYSFDELAAESGFDFATDLRDEKGSSGSHINSYGAQKITRYMGKLLVEKYDSQDRRGDPEYAFYDRMAREWDVEYALHDMNEAQNIQDYVEAVNPDLMRATLICYKSKAKLPEASALDALLEAETDVEGLYTRARWNDLNRVWELSERIRLKVGEGGIKSAVLYDGAQAVKIKKCHYCVVVVDSQTGRLLDKAEFTKSGKNTKRA